MSIKGGSKSCEIHDWVEDPSRWVEQCMAFKCSKCGATGCGCDVLRQKEDLKSGKIKLDKILPFNEKFDRVVELILHDPEFDCSEVIKYMTRLYLKDNWQELKETDLIKKYVR